MHVPMTPAEAATEEAAAEPKPKRQRTAGGAKRSRGVRRPYRGLESEALQARLDVLGRREEGLRVKHDRAAETLGRLRAEHAARAAAEAPA